MLERRLITVEGVVQGVGFRPYVHRLASANALCGSVRNAASDVLIDIEGESSGVEEFCRTLTLRPPALASIANVRVSVAAPRAYEMFHIAPSDAPTRATAALRVPADVATCDACLAELFAPGNRRYRHPFITCTDCGPRLTIAREAPFDRERTSMAGFAMCRDCRREYENPRDRRFHAETISCPSCGPTLSVWRSDEEAARLTGEAALAVAVDTIRTGSIVALKALGGYHLACDATSTDAVDRLRARKGRAAKPLAVMVRDARQVAELCVVSAAERQLLESTARPIVLLDRRPATRVAVSVAPGQRTLGVMLPATPLHHLLLAALDRPLVMTSGNRSDEPVAIAETEAVEMLGGVADLFLTHDRPIVVRCDDSVVRASAGKTRLVRRSRGYAPGTVSLPVSARQPVLAVGGHLKNTICIAHGHAAVLSPHVGELDTATARQAFRDAISATSRLCGVEPTVIAHDLHPDYASTRAAHELMIERGLVHRVPVQHHHAHVAACVAEHGVPEPVIGVVFDGAGLGTDGAIWGGEFLLVDGARVQRRGHLGYIPLPGGDAAARRPWRSAAAHLAQAGAAPRAFDRPIGVEEREWRLVHQLLEGTRDLPRTSSAGRLFDAVASLLGVCHVARFEGEAPMALEAAADTNTERSYTAPLSAGESWTADVGAIIRSVVDDRDRGRSIGEVAGAFHLAMRDLVVDGCERVRETSGVTTVVLSGGVFMNALLLERSIDALSARRFRVLTPARVPCNDGGLSLGQAYVAVRALEEDSCA